MVESKRHGLVEENKWLWAWPWGQILCHSLPAFLSDSFCSPRENNLDTHFHPGSGSAQIHEMEFWAQIILPLVVSMRHLFTMTGKLTTTKAHNAPKCSVEGNFQIIRWGSRFRPQILAPTHISNVARKKDQESYENRVLTSILQIISTPPESHKHPMV